MRKALSLLLVLALVLSFAPMAFAEPYDPARTTGSLTVTKFVMDRLPAVNAFGTNDGTQFTGDLSAFEPLGGVDFTVVRVEPCAAGTTGAVYNAQHSEWYAPVASPITVATNASGVALFSALPLGVYYVVEQPTAAGLAPTDPSAPFFVSVPTILQAAGAADDYLYDVFAYPKNEDINITKEIIPATVASGNADTMGAGLAYGDTISYKLTVDVPTDIAAYEMLKVTDFFEEGLRFTGLQSAVAKGHATAADKPNVHNDETVKTLAGATVTNYSADGGTVELDFSDAVASLDGYTKLEITLNFVITTNASLNFSIDNSATLDVTNRYGHDKHRETEVPKVYTGGIKIFKHDSVITDLGLQGAEFVLVPVSTGVYATDAGLVTDGVPANALKNTNATVLVKGVSDANGLVEFKGIPYGVLAAGVYTPSDSLYWLVEIKAPTGYKAPGGTPIQVTINGSSWDADATAIEAEVKVANVKGFNFPLTGGAGTAMFITAGLALASLSWGSYKLSRKDKETTD